MSSHKVDPEVLKLAAEDQPHAKRIHNLVKQLERKAERLRTQADSATDDRRRQQYLSELRAILRTLEWLPEAAQIPAAPVRFGSRSSKRAHIAIGVPEAIKRPLRFQQYIFDTSDPVEIAALRYHMSRGIEPRIEEIPPGFVPSFVGGRRPRFYAFVPEEMAREAILSGAANPIMP